MRGEEIEKKMTKRMQVARAPEPLEEYLEHFDPWLSKSNQREGLRRYVEGLLLPSERHKTLTGLVNTEPIVGAHLPRAQKLQWFVSESDWDERKVQAERLRLLRQDEITAPNAHGVLVIDETGDRKDGHKTAHVGRQYLGNVGKIDNGVVSVTSLWADERVYYPVDFEPYTPESYFAKGRNDPAFRTKLKIALQLVQQAVEQGLAQQVQTRRGEALQKLLADEHDNAKKAGRLEEPNYPEPTPAPAPPEQPQPTPNP